jgi:FAD/FMN-containing dehydrogenase
MVHVAVVQAHKPLSNWNLTEETIPDKLVVAKSIEDVCAVVNDSITYASPVLAVGSMHSVNGCITNTGTILDMSGGLSSRAAYAVLFVAERGNALLDMLIASNEPKFL